MLLANAQLIALEARLFHGLADPSRLAILRALLEGPLTVNEIAARTALSQSNTSNHLACLRGGGLVTTTQNGRFVSYALSDARAAQILALADEMLAAVAKSMYECAHFQPAPRRAHARATASGKPRARTRRTPRG